MAVETSKMFEGTAHALDCMFSHDALSLLTAIETVQWMKDNRHTDGRTYYEMWLKPLHGLNAGTDYADRPPGNSPELMPLDASLNNDVHTCVDMHVAFTHHLKPGDLGYEKRCSVGTRQQSRRARTSDCWIQTSVLKQERRSAIGSAKISGNSSLRLKRFATTVVSLFQT